VYPGFKMNLPDVCAAIGLAQIRKYETLLNERKRVYEAYNAFFLKHAWAIVPPFQLPNTSSSYHIYPLRIKHCSEEQRDQIIQLLTQASIAVNVHFIPLPLLSIFSEHYSIKHFPQALDQFQTEISLPIYPQLNNNQIQYIVTTVEKAVT
ncbi:DegT/DnrJ/EryC1/StrS family aminotransferase, partial [Bacillus pumilus]|uniref:DegT/DnrJ/EryC1/StrS family aminotransferase n=1 Tax=Bacillus pumilus TaxID=1408 RepID=UPI0033162A0E